MRNGVFHVLNSSTPGWRARSKQVCGHMSPTPSDLSPQPRKPERKMFWSDAWDLSSSLFFSGCGLIQCWWDNGDDSSSPCCCLLIVKSGLSWGICPGRAPYPQLWTGSRFPLGRLGGETAGGEGGWALNFMRPTPRPIVLRGRQRVPGYNLRDAETEQMHGNPQAWRCLNPDMWRKGNCGKNLLLKKRYGWDLCTVAITVEEDLMCPHFINYPGR